MQPDRAANVVNQKCMVVLSQCCMSVNPLTTLNNNVGMQFVGYIVRHDLIKLYPQEIGATRQTATDSVNTFIIYNRQCIYNVDMLNNCDMKTSW